MFIKIFIAIVALSLANPISEHGCQCQGPCQKAGNAIFFDPKCQITQGICADASDGDRDKCDSSLWSQGTGAVAQWFTNLWSDAGAATEKLGQWSRENIQKLSVEEVKEHAKNMGIDVIQKLSDAQLHAISIQDVGNWGKDKLDQFSQSDFARFTQEQVQGMNTTWVNEKIKAGLEAGEASTTNLLSKVSAEQLKDFSKETIAKFKSADWQSLNLEAVGEWSKDKIEAIPVDEFKNFTKKQLSKIPVEKMKDFTKAQYDAMTWENTAGFTKRQWDKVPVDTITGFTWEKIQQVPWERMGNFTKAQWDKVPFDTLIRMSGEQINKIDPETLEEFSGSYWYAMPIAHISHFTAEQLQVSGILPNLHPDRVAQISDSAWKAMPVGGGYIAFAVEQLQRVNYTSMSTWSQEKWNSVNVDEMIKLTGKRLRAIPAENVAKFTTEQWQKIPLDDMVAFSGKQINNAATLAKLEIEQLAVLYQTGELDTSFLGDRKAELEEYIKNKCDGKCTSTNLKNLIFKYDEAQTKVDEAKTQVAIIENTPYRTAEARAEAVEAAKQELDTAVAEKEAAKEELAKEDYTVKEYAGISVICDPDPNSVGQLTVGLSVALATMISGL